MNRYVQFLYENRFLDIAETGPVLQFFLISNPALRENTQILWWSSQQ